MQPTERATLFRLRCVLALFMAGLIVSGITAFPLERETEVLASMRGLDHPGAAAVQTSLDNWLLKVRDGLRDTYARYPWVAYGTDWLAFAHIVIAIFFVGALIDPVRNVWVLWAGLIACILVLPLALICGPIRHIPVRWRLIDCSFGVFGAIPVCYCLWLVRRLKIQTRGASAGALSDAARDQATL